MKVYDHFVEDKRSWLQVYDLFTESISSKRLTQIMDRVFPANYRSLIAYDRIFLINDRILSVKIVDDQSESYTSSQDRAFSFHDHT